MNRRNFIWRMLMGLVAFPLWNWGYQEQSVEQDVKKTKAIADAVWNTDLNCYDPTTETISYGDTYDAATDSLQAIEDTGVLTRSHADNNLVVYVDGSGNTFYGGSDDGS